MESVENSPAQNKEWLLTKTAFDKLLAWLDADRELAGARLENVRRKLIKFFEFQGCLSPEEYADATIDRVARMIAQGVKVQASDPALYFHGVARNVLKEYWRKPERKSSSLESIVPSQQPGEDPSALEEEESAQQIQERQYQCLNRCVQSLSPEYQELIVQYYYAQGRTKIQNRHRLAEELKITVNALRIRAHRIRDDLEECVAGCLKQLQAS